MSALSRIGLIPNLLGLGMFWGLSPIVTKYLAMMHVSPFMTITFSGFGVGIGLFIVWRSIGKVELASWRLWLFGTGCAILLNMPFGLSLMLIGHVPVATYSIITSTTPLFGYAIALTLGVERMSLSRALAILCGFGGSALLLVNPDAANSSELLPVIDIYTLACFALPLFYALYHVFASRFWPKGAETGAVSIAESISSGVIVLPFLILIDGSSAVDIPQSAFIALGAVTLLWVVERITFFNLVRNFGPVSTVQAVNLSTVSSVLLGHFLFGEPIDARLIVSGALVLTALWLNSKAERARKSAEAIA
jgi:hypothetical protein